MSRFSSKKQNGHKQRQEQQTNEANDRKFVEEEAGRGYDEAKKKMPHGAFVLAQEGYFCSALRR